MKSLPLLACLFVTSCAAIYSQVEYWECSPGAPPPLYGGAQLHVEGFRKGHGVIAHTPVWFTLPDFPLSLAVDTALLPMTLVQAIGKLAGLYPTVPSAETEIEDPDEWTRRAGKEQQQGTDAPHAFSWKAPDAREKLPKT